MDLNLGRIGQIAFTVKDIEKTIDFYGGKLGLRQTMRPHPGMVFFDCAGQNLMINQRSPAEAEGDHGASILYFDCADIALCVKELASRGLEPAHPAHRVAPMPDHDLWMVFYKDPDDRFVGLRMTAPKGYELPAG